MAVRRSARTRRHRLAPLAAAGCVAGCAALSVVAPSAVAAPTGSASASASTSGSTTGTTPNVSIAVSPKNLFTGEQVTATGTASTAVARTVRLKRFTSGAWATVAWGTTTSAGGYQLTDPESRVGQYKVVLPETTSGPAQEWVQSDTATVLRSSVLPAGRTMTSNQFLLSSTGAWQLALHSTGNLVLVRLSDGAAVWDTATYGHPGDRLVMQDGGNLVLVDPDGSVLWSTGTSGPGGYLTLHTDGTMEIKDGGQVLWDRSTGLHGAPTQTDATVRADSWVAARVPYSQSRYYSNRYGSYRTDCSGFVSMALDLSTSYTTRTLPDITSVISKSDLRTGDILNAYDYHVVLFDKWANAAKTEYWIYEESPSGGATHHVIPYPYYSGHRTSSFVPRRLDAAKMRQMASRGAQMSQGSDAGPVDVP